MGKYLAPCHDLLTSGLGSNTSLLRTRHYIPFCPYTQSQTQAMFLSVLCLFDAIHDCFALTVEVTLT